MIRVVIAGFRGKMGEVTTKMILSDSRFQLVGVVSETIVEKNLMELTEYSKVDIPIFKSKEEVVSTVIPDVWIDFTSPKHIYKTVLFLVEHNIHPVIGTTG
ncbi:hypothetical protein J8385_20255, partial [Acinetobacter baumannii]|nr:hypothetical protein [Acinetobacter baumannii]